MRFDLTDLKLFTAIIRNGSITKGAEAMNLALASASQRVSGMEAMLGVALLERVARGVKPTEAGAELLRHADEILLRTDRMLGQLQGFSKGRRGRIRLLSNTSAFLGFLPNALKSFLLDHPGIDVEVEEHTSIEIIRLVTEGAAELGIVADVVDPGRLSLKRLVEDRLVAVVPTGHAMASLAQIDFAAVLREPLVGLLDAALERHLAEHAQHCNIRPHHRVRLRNIGGIGRMVEAGVGLAILPVSTLPDLAGMDLAFVPLADGWTKRRLALCLRDDREPTGMARLLMDHLVDSSDRGTAVL